MPTRDTSEYTKIAYNSLRRYNSHEHEIIVLDDNSDDDTQQYFESIKSDKNLVYIRYNQSPAVGHPLLYNKGFEIAKNEICTIFHSDMVSSKNYINKMLKHLEPGVIVSATRIEPPVYPADAAKILKNFGMIAMDFNEHEFINFCEEESEKQKNKLTYGIFAPWMIYKKDFELHESWWPFEDSDLFQRLLLKGIKPLQPRDVFVYHFGSRAHKGWAKNGIGNDSLEFKRNEHCAKRDYLRKWHCWIMNDQYSRPIIPHVFDVCFEICGVSENNDIHKQIIYNIEPWCSCIYLDNQQAVDNYLASEQKNTKLDLKKRVKYESKFISNDHDVSLSFDINDFEKDFNTNFIEIVNMTKNIIECGGKGIYEYGCFELHIKEGININSTLVKSTQSNE